jgi:hypothetical protein
MNRRLELPRLEKLEDRTLLSAWPMTEGDQLLTLVEQDNSNEIRVVNQAIADVMSYVERLSHRQPGRFARHFPLVGYRPTQRGDLPNASRLPRRFPPGW